MTDLLDYVVWSEKFQIFLDAHGLIALNTLTLDMEDVDQKKRKDVVFQGVQKN